MTHDDARWKVRCLLVASAQGMPQSADAGRSCVVAGSVDRLRNDHAMPRQRARRLDGKVRRTAGGIFCCTAAVRADSAVHRIGAIAPVDPTEKVRAVREAGGMRGSKEGAIRTGGVALPVGIQPGTAAPGVSGLKRLRWHGFPCAAGGPMMLAAAAWAFRSGDAGPGACLLSVDGTANCVGPCRRRWRARPCGGS